MTKTEIFTREGRLTDQDNLLILVYVSMTHDGEHKQLISFNGAWDRRGVPLACTDYDPNRGIDYWTQKEQVEYDV